MSVLIIGDYSYLGKSVRGFLYNHGFKIFSIDFRKSEYIYDENFYLFSDIKCLCEFCKEKKVNIIINISYISEYFHIESFDNTKLVAEKIDISISLLNKINQFFQSLEYKENFAHFVCFPNSIYGTQEEFCSEASAINPGNFRAGVAASIFNFHQVYQKQFSLPTTSIIVGNLYGENLSDKNIFFQVINSIINRKNILIHGNGKRMRNWLFVPDFCYMLYLAILNNIRDQNLCFASENLFFIDFIKKICNKLDNFFIKNSLEYETKSLLKFTASVQKSNDSYAMRASRTNNLLKYTNQSNTDDVLDDLIQKYMEKFNIFK